MTRFFRVRYFINLNIIIFSIIFFLKWKKKHIIEAFFTLHLFINTKEYLYVYRQTFVQSRKDLCKFNKRKYTTFHAIRGGFYINLMRAYWVCNLNLLKCLSVSLSVCLYVCMCEICARCKLFNRKIIKWLYWTWTLWNLDRT